MKSENHCDIQILKQCLAGHTQAFESLVGKYQGLICAVTYSATGKTDVSEDLAQDTFMQAWKNLGQLEDLSKFRSWLLSIAKRCILNYFRNNQQTGATADVDLIANQPATGATPADEAVSKEEEAMVSEAMMRLPKNYRVPMVLYYRQQHSISQVAAIMGQPESTVRVHLHRGRQMLKEHVESMIDRTLSRTAPTKAFAGAVITAILVSTAGKSAAAAASQATGSGTGGTLGTLIGSTASKITAAAAAVLITASAVFVYMNQSDANANTAEPITQILPAQTEPAAQSLEPAPAALAQAPAKSTKPVEPAAPARPQVKPPAVAAVQPDKTQPRVEHVQEESYSFQTKGVLSGLITDIETGQPVTDAEVSISPGRLYRAKTDENGFYSFEKVDQNGNYDIGVYSTEYIGIIEYDKRPKIHLTQNGKEVQHFQLEKACMIDVYVMDTDGKPIKDVRLWTTSCSDEYGREVGRSYASVRTNEDGYLRLGGFAPSQFQYQINAMHTRYGEWITKNGQRYKPAVSDYAPGYVKVMLTEPNLIEYGEIILQKGTTVQGIAKYTDGTPAKECKIVPFPEWWHSTTNPPGFEIDPNGVFTLEQIVPGAYRIQASVPIDEHSATGYGLFTAQLPLGKGLLEVTVPRKPNKKNSTSMQADTPRPKLYGMVIDAETKKPIIDFQMRAIKLRGSSYVQPGRWTQFKDNKGAFEMDVVAEAVYRVQAIANGYAAAWSGEIDTAKNAAVLVKLSRGGSVSGRIVDTNGRPVTDATVLPGSTASDIKSSGERVFESEIGAVVTDTMGRFVLKHLPDGVECLKVTHPDFTYTFVSDVKVKSGKEHRIGKIILNTGGTVAGIFRDNSGKPQAGVTLYAQNHYGYSTSEVRYATAITEPNGFYRFEHLPEEMVYITRPSAYKLTGVVSCGLIPQNETVTTMDIGSGPAVSGQLVINGQPLANTRMMLQMGQWSATGLYRCHADTDGSGRFTLAAGRPGLYTLSYERRGKISSTLTTKLLDIQIVADDIDLGSIPSDNKSVRVQFETPSDPQGIQYFYLREDDPFNGPCVFRQDELKISEMPYVINGLKPGQYYAVIRSGQSWGESRYPITIADEDDILDVTIPAVQGAVTLTGALPEGISRVWYTDSSNTISGLLYNNKDGVFRVDGLPAGKYRFTPKWPWYEDALTIDIPNEPEYKLKFEPEQLRDMLKERVMVYAFDEHGQPAENTRIWIESGGRKMTPAYHDGYGCTFYLSGGEHVIHAENGSLKAMKPYKLMQDKNNTASGESLETFIQLLSKPELMTH